MTTTGVLPLRRLRLRGGELDGSTWQAEIDVGYRIACGAGPWSRSRVYVVTSDVVPGPDGSPENIAVPAPF
jgi:hypothetical protein